MTSMDLVIYVMFILFKIYDTLILFSMFSFKVDLDIQCQCLICYKKKEIVMANAFTLSQTDL